jgi:2-octaprenyl-6-methoxyphenol hydroxylase
VTRDVVIVGAGPVGATLALALRDADLDVVVIDGRPAGLSTRADRSLALSHGARLILERLDVWTPLAAAPGAVTPIVAIDISQARGFVAVRLEAREHGLPELGYGVS